MVAEFAVSFSYQTLRRYAGIDNKCDESFSCVNICLDEPGRMEHVIFLPRNKGHKSMSDPTRFVGRRYGESLVHASPSVKLVFS